MLNNKRLMLFLSMTCLIFIGLVMIYSSSYIWAEYKFDNGLKYVIQQSIFAIFGYFLIYIILKIDSNVF